MSPTDLCRCEHTRAQHQGPEGIGGAQCLICPGDEERAWRHPFTEKDAEPELCPWEVYIGSLETPPEPCDLEVEPGDEYCPKHQKTARALEEL
jgi:hypothetical protein